MLGLGRGRFTSEAAAKYLKQKESEGVGGNDGIGAQQGQGIETTASVKAKIAARALRATQGAPEHIRKTAAAVAGRQMAKVM
jgi:hypothetical protein